MSYTAIKGAFRELAKTKMGMPARLVLLVLSNRHNQETGRCDPSIATICADTQLSERSVRAALRELEKLGLLATTQRRCRSTTGVRNLTNAYKLKGGAQYAGGVGHNMPPNQEYTRASAYDDLAMLIEDPEEEEAKARIPANRDISPSVSQAEVSRHAEKGDSRNVGAENRTSHSAHSKQNPEPLNFAGGAA